MDSPKTLAQNAFIDLITPDDIPREEFEKRHIELLPRHKPTCQMLFFFWETDWADANPDKAAYLERISDMAFDVARKHDSPVEGVKVADAYITMEEGSSAIARETEYYFEREEYVVREMVDLLEQLEKPVPAEIIRYQRSLEFLNRHGKEFE